MKKTNRKPQGLMILALAVLMVGSALLFSACGGSSSSPSGPTGPSGPPAPTATVCGVTFLSSYTFGTSTECWAPLAGNTPGSFAQLDPANPYSGTGTASLETMNPSSSGANPGYFGLSFTTPVAIPNGTFFSFWYKASTTTGNINVNYMTTNASFNTSVSPLETVWTNYSCTMAPNNYPVTQIAIVIPGLTTSHVTVWINAVTITLPSTATPTPTSTGTVTSTPSVTGTPTPTTSPTPTNTRTQTTSPTPTGSITSTPTPSPTPTNTSAASPTSTPTPTATENTSVGNYVAGEIWFYITTTNGGSPVTTYSLRALVATNGSPYTSAGVTITDPNTTNYVLTSSGNTASSNGASCEIYTASPASFSTSGTFSLAVSTNLATTTSAVTAVTGTSALAGNDLSVSWSTSNLFNLLVVENETGTPQEVFTTTSNTSPVALTPNPYVSGDKYAVSDSRYNASTVTNGTGSFAYFQDNVWNFTY